MISLSPSLSAVSAMLRAVSSSGWAGVRDRVLRLRDLPGEWRGRSRAEWFALEPVLSVADMAALEGWLGMRLPEQYRSFLIEVAAGGAGPCGWVSTVRRHVSGGWCWGGHLPDIWPSYNCYCEWELDPAALARPFPTWRMDHHDRAVLFGPPPFEENFTDPDAFQAAFDAWAAPVNAGFLAPERTDGAVEIAQRGCALSEWLILAGPAAGTIWHDDRADGADMAPARDRAGQPLTFHRWYLDWLESAERDTRFR